MSLMYYVKKINNMYSTKIWTPINKMLFRIQGITYGKNLRVRGVVLFITHSKDSKVCIGNNVTINSSTKANPIGCGNRTYIQMIGNGKLVIGNNCGISNTAITCATQVVIEDNVLIGSGCHIFDTDFHAQEYAERIKGNYYGAPIKTKAIKICEGAFVGAEAFILKGVTVGKHSIVGAGSVVTKDVPNYEIWAGNPARFLRKIDEND